MKIALFGATGRLGQALAVRLSKDGHEVIGLARTDCNLLNPDAIGRVLSLLTPDCVVNAAAMNGLEACEVGMSSAIQINAAAPCTMAMYCAARGAIMMHYSTDYVFSGPARSYTEDCPPSPFGFYGSTKLWGEQAVLLTKGPHYVFRVSSLYGNDYSGMLGPLKQVLQEEKGFDEDKPVNVLHQFCAPVSTHLVADATAHVLLRPEHLKASKWGLYHLTTREGVWKTAFTRYLLQEVIDAERDWIVEPGKLKLPRPVYSHLIVNKFQEAFCYTLPSWRDDLAEMLPFVDTRNLTVE